MVKMDTYIHLYIYTSKEHSINLTYLVTGSSFILEGGYGDLSV